MMASTGGGGTGGGGTGASLEDEALLALGPSCCP